MIEEDYVSFEQAKLLKEKGFPQGGLNQYDEDGVTWEPYVCPLPKYAKPTLSLVQKWLKEENGIEVYVTPDLINPGLYYNFGCWHINSDKSYVGTCKTYEEALSAGIDKALELIKE